MAKQKWTDERTAELVAIVGVVSDVEVSIDVVNQAADALSVTTRSIASKLRNMEYTVESSATVATKRYSEAQEAEIESFVVANSGLCTFGEIAAQVCGGDFTAKSLQGKLLSMELTNHVKPTEKQETAKQYTDSEEATFIEMANSGSSAEDIAEALGKTLKSVMGKSLSLSRSVEGFTRPVQTTSSAKVKADALEALGDLAALTVEEIASAIDKTVRGVKTMLTHRALTCSDYDGAKRAAKNAEKAAASA